MKTAIYIRVSTQEQVDEGYSISAQKHKLQAYCISQNWEVVGFYIDEGISAKSTDRPELQRMNEHIKMGLIECVLVYKLDRLTRSVLDLYKLLEFFDKYDCKFKSASEVYDTTNAMGKLFITIVAALAQWERENLGERVRVGLEEKVRQGKYAAHVKPFGYSLDNSKGELTIIPEEARIVRMIFKKYLEGYSTNKISNSLIGTPGATWSDVVVYQILKNPIYKGTLRWGKNTNNYIEVDDAVPPIISKELFDEVQNHLKNRGLQHPRAAASDYIFSGIIKCGLCGNSLVGSKVKRNGIEYKSYRCKGRSLGKCNLNVSQRIVEQLFFDYISDWQKYGQEVSKTEVEIEPPEDDREDIEQELKIIAKRRKKWQLAWANDSITDEEFTERMKEETEKEKYLTEKLDTAAPSKNHSNEELQEILLNLEDNWIKLAEYEKKTFINLFLESIVITRKPGIKTKYDFSIEDINFN